MKLVYDKATKTFSKDNELDLDSVIPKLNQSGWVKADTPWNEYDLRSEKYKCDISLIQKNGWKPTNAAPRSLMPTSNADKWDFYIKILGFYITDYFGNEVKGKLDPRYANNKKLFEYLENNDLIEATDCKVPQWGTWKYKIGDADDLDDVINGINKCIK